MRKNIGLYRGKSVDTNEWIVGYLWSPRTIGYTSAIGNTDEIVVDPSTIGECTGLADKNNKLIFEGDILRSGDKNLVVWWNEEAFQWQAKEVTVTDVMCTFDGTARTRCVYDNIDLGWIASEIPILGRMTTEIIGNIYDNPELLEENRTIISFSF